MRARPFDPPTHRLLRSSPRLLGLMVVSACAMYACGDSGAGGRITPTPPPTGVDASDDTTAPVDIGGIDAPLPDTGADAADAGPGADAGEPCEEDDDCASGWCVRLDPRPEGRICLNPCLSDTQCADGEACVLIRNMGGDGVSVCLSPTFCIDRDGDGWGIGPGCSGDDCDDTRDDVHPGADERCDGLDNDCNGRVDDRPVDTGAPCDTGFAGACGPGRTACLLGSLVCASDVSDAPEACNGIDDDCDGRVDDGAGCFGEGEPCVDGTDCATGLCVLSVCAVPVPPCHVDGTCPPRAALTSGGADRLRTDDYTLELTLGGALPAHSLRTSQHQLSLGIPVWRNDP